MTALTWRSDGKVLAVTQACGALSLYTAENATLLYRFAPNPPASSPASSSSASLASSSTSASSSAALPMFSFLPALRLAGTAGAASNLLINKSQPPSFWSTTHSVWTHFPFAHRRAVACLTWTRQHRLPKSQLASSSSHLSQVHSHHHHQSVASVDCSRVSLPFADSVSRLSAPLPRCPRADVHVFSLQPLPPAVFQPVTPPPPLTVNPAMAAASTLAPMKPPALDFEAQLNSQHVHSDSPLHISIDGVKSATAGRSQIHHSSLTTSPHDGQLEVLISTDLDGKVMLHAFGVFPLAWVNLHAVLKQTPSLLPTSSLSSPIAVHGDQESVGSVLPLSVSLSSDLRLLTVMAQVAPSTQNGDDQSKALQSQVKSIKLG